MTTAPATAKAKVPAEAVATLEIPIYRPVEAFGTMSLIRAQSTARNAPADPAKMAAPNIATGSTGATAPRARPTAPATHEA